MWKKRTSKTEREWKVNQQTALTYRIPVHLITLRFHFRSSQFCFYSFFCFNSISLYYVLFTFLVWFLCNFVMVYILLFSFIIVLGFGSCWCCWWECCTNFVRALCRQCITLMNTIHVLRALFFRLNLNECETIWQRIEFHLSHCNENVFSRETGPSAEIRIEFCSQNRNTYQVESF